MIARGVDVQLPVTSHHAKKNDDNRDIVVSITRDGTVYVGADRTPLDKLGAAVAAREAAPPRQGHLPQGRRAPGLRAGPAGHGRDPRRRRRGRAAGDRRGDVGTASGVAGGALTMSMSVGGGGATAGRFSARGEINVTPLIDIVLVLLIVFMVMTPVMLKELIAKIPQEQSDNTPQPPGDNPIVVSLAADGNITLGSEPIAIERAGGRGGRAADSRSPEGGFLPHRRPRELRSRREIDGPLQRRRRGHAWYRDEQITQATKANSATCRRLPRALKNGTMPPHWWCLPSRNDMRRVKELSMKRLFWRLAPEMVLCLGDRWYGVRVGGCSDPNNSVPAGPPVLNSWSVIDNATGASLDLTARRQPDPDQRLRPSERALRSLARRTHGDRARRRRRPGHRRRGHRRPYARRCPAGVGHGQLDLHAQRRRRSWPCSSRPARASRPRRRPTFPSGSTITATLDKTKVRSKKGEPFTVDGDLASGKLMFQTLPFSVAITVPMGDADPDAGADAGPPPVSPMMQAVTLTFTNLPGGNIQDHVTVTANGAAVHRLHGRARQATPTVVDVTPDDRPGPPTPPSSSPSSATATDALGVPIDARGQRILHHERKVADARERIDQIYDEREGESR